MLTTSGWATFLTVVLKCLVLQISPSFVYLTLIHIKGIRLVKIQRMQDMSNTLVWEEG